MGTRSCGLQDIKDNIASAEQEKRLYGGVEVIVTATDNTTIEFMLYGDRTASRYKADFADTKQVWPKCPTTFTADNHGAPSKGEFGTLYLSEQFLKDHLIAAAPKWPPRMDGPEPPTARLPMYPLKLELTAIELKSGFYEKATINLLDPAYGNSKQTIKIDGTSPISVELTEESFKQLFLPFTPDEHQVSDALETIKRPGSKKDFATALALIAKTAAAIEDGAVVTDELRYKINEILAKLT